jgi:hypothetical protein
MLPDEELNTFLDVMIDAWAWDRGGEVAAGRRCFVTLKGDL